MVFIGIVYERRSPYGERGLKSSTCGAAPSDGCRSPYGERGLKFRIPFLHGIGERRSPYGERGLKSV